MNGEFPCGINKSENMYWVYNKMPTWKPETPCHEFSWTTSGNISFLKNLPQLWNFPNFISGEKESLFCGCFETQSKKNHLSGRDPVPIMMWKVTAFMRGGW